MLTCSAYSCTHPNVVHSETPRDTEKDASSLSCPTCPKPLQISSVGYSSKRPTTRWPVSLRNSYALVEMFSILRKGVAIFPEEHEGSLNTWPQGQKGLRDGLCLSRCVGLILVDHQDIDYLGLGSPPTEFLLLLLL